MRRLTGAPSATGQAKPDNNRDKRSRTAITKKAHTQSKETSTNKKGLLKNRPFSVRFDNA
jgi:hypothetical protein